MDQMARQSAASVRTFTCDPERDRDICPAGKERIQHHVAGRCGKAKLTRDGRYTYRSRKTDCDVCLLQTHTATGTGCSM